MTLKFYICAQEEPNEPIEILDSFRDLDDAIDCLEELQCHLPDQNFWIGSVPYKPPADSIPDPLIL